MTGEEDPDLPTFAAKLNYLYATVHPPGRGPYSNDEVSAAVASGGEDSLSVSYLYTLRAGKRTNPGLRYVDALARFFGVDPNFFFDRDVARAVTAELAFVTALRDAGVKGLALRAAGLSEVSLEQLAQMVEHVRHLEGLPEATESSSADSDDDPDRPRQSPPTPTP